MVQWRVITVARGAINQPIMVKIDLYPIVRYVAVRALPVIMVRRRLGRVAGHTVRQAVMLNLRPIFGNVTVGTLAAIMACRPCMTRFTIGVGYMVKVNV